MSRTRGVLVFIALAMALGLVAVGCGGSDGDDSSRPAVTPGPTITAGPLADGEPEQLVRRGLRRLLSDSYRATAVSRVRLNDDTSESLRDQAQAIEQEAEVRIESEGRDRRATFLPLRTESGVRDLRLVQYDGAGFIAVDSDRYRPIRPGLLEELGGTEAESIEVLLDAAGPFRDAGDAVRDDVPVRVYEAPLDPDPVLDANGFSGLRDLGATFGDATVRFELRVDDGRLVSEGVDLRAEIDAGQASNGAAEGTLVVDIVVDFVVTDLGERVTVTKPEATGDPITSAAELGEFIDGGP